MEGGWQGIERMGGLGGGVFEQELGRERERKLIRVYQTGVSLKIIIKFVNSNFLYIL